MPWIGGAACLLWTLSDMLTLAQGDSEASCVFMESCTLPCIFQGGINAVIHWTQAAGDTPVHSYYHDQDQLARQDQRFRGRTSLFKDQISRGNASLLLTGLEVQDQGRYKCFTSTISGNKDSYVNLKVDAPVTEVDIQQVENRINCSSEGIYPKPEVTWSTSPPSKVTFKNTTAVTQTEQQLYNINSCLIVSDNVTHLIYSCNVSTDRHWRRATLRQLSSISDSSSDTTILCGTSNSSRAFNLVWRFNHSQIILSQTGVNASPSVSEGWRQQVKGVSESGSLTLQDLTSNQEGIYTCELRNDEETYVTSTFLTIEKVVSGSRTSIIVAVVFGVVLAVVLVLGFRIIKRRPGLWSALCESSLCLVCRKEEQTQSPHVLKANACLRDDPSTQ